jgi:hypothetical protein
MRGLAFLVLSVAMLFYVVTRPAASPPGPTAYAQLPAKPLETAKPESRPELLSKASQGRTALAPLDINPATQPTQAKPKPAEAPVPQSKTKETAAVLTAAAIAALIVAESRRAYHATGHPCACPNDAMRNGRACGSRSAYRRPGGAAPLCYPTDVTETMIKSYRERQLAAR